MTAAGITAIGKRSPIPSLCALLGLCLLLATTLPAQGARPWPTTRFQVFVGSPFEGSNWQSDLVGIETLDGEEDDDGPHPRAVEDVERAFSEAARWYQRKGFPPPNIEPIVDTPEGPAYRVYLCKPRTFGFACGYDPGSKQDNAGIYVSRCGNQRDRARFLYMNRNKTISNLGLNELGYQTVAHELMHAIIDNTAFGTPSPCGTINYWITESLPDAISFDIMEEIWQNRFEVDTSMDQVIKRFGYRPYYEPLTESGLVTSPSGDKQHLKYVTSSFWRYLADSHTDGWGILLTRKPGAAPGLLDISVADNRGWQSEVRWLQTGLQGKFNRSLADMYGLFVNHLAYSVAPMPSFRDRPAEANLARWVEKLFGDCPSADLSASASQDVTLDLKPLASGCIWVEPTGVEGPVQITFQAASEDQSLLKDISIGQASSGLVSRANPVSNTKNSEGLYLASWRDYPQDGSSRTLYLVSNVAARPEQSRTRRLTLEVVRPGNTNSARFVAPMQTARVAQPAKRPSYQKHAKSLAQQKRDTANMINEQMNLDKQSLNPNVSGATSVLRRPDQPDCTEPFVYTACGPHTAISLSLRPGTYTVPGQTNAQGGMAAQTFGGLQAMSQTSLFDTESNMRALQARVDEIDGSAVHITLPLIDYGFSGSINNADISVDMSGGRRWRAFGPPDAEGRTRLTGSVTIDEFTPFVIRGSFEAPLAEFETGEQGPVYRRRQTVTGTFSSVAPWQSDDRIPVLTEGNEQLADDIANTLGVPADMVYSMKQKGTMPGAASAPATGAGAGSSTSGGGALTGECSCECDMRAFADDLCELFCEEEFAVCDAP